MATRADERGGSAMAFGTAMEACRRASRLGVPAAVEVRRLRRAQASGLRLAELLGRDNGRRA